MRAVLTNLGSSGDIQPLLALAVELRRHNHRPVLALAPYFARYVEKLGLEFIPVGPDLNYPELQRRETTAVMRGVNHLEMMPGSLDILDSMLPQLFSDLSDACRDADVLISGQLQMASRMIHELTDIPFVSIHTNHFGGKQPPNVSEAVASIINPFRTQFGLGPVCDPVHTDANSPQLALYAMSRYFRPPAPDWPDHYHVTGFFFMGEQTWEADASLVRFLNQGPPPVIITFSSVAHDDPHQLTKLLLKAIQIAGCRAIIQRGWSGLGEGSMPPHVQVVDFVQHTWLFTRARCVVHHGGPGTGAAAILAGVPSVIIPHVGDQPLWAELTRDLGCAGFVIPYKQLTAERLGAAIATTLATDLYYRNTAAMGEKIRAEQGVKRARYLIEQLLDKVGLNQKDDSAMECQEQQEKIDRRKFYQQNRRAKRLGKSEPSSIEE
jgi:UDP:flavonoid glycosyltransferase YjiC (YdhE family)